MPPIYLIGFMCSGKTTLGRALAQKLGIEFIDLDQMIEQQAGMTVRQMFDQLGEAAFRTLEREALTAVSSRNDVIVACGGGTPCQPGAMDLMNNTGTTVRLVPSERRLLRRLIAGRHKRPLLAAIESIDEMRDYMIFTIAKRDADYSKARYRFDTSYLENQQEIAQTVEAFVDRFINHRI